jgi:hypothetical protein
MTWRGCLETASGQRQYFHSLTDLNRLIRDCGGWIDPPMTTKRENLT